jgi:hypothetical protein
MIDAMLDAYIACALWSSTDNAATMGETPLDDNYGPEDLAPETRAAMRTDCEAFLAKCGGLIEACAGRIKRDDSPFSKAGHDLWLTRNGHGCGFWDGDWPEPEASRLDAAAKAMGTCDLYVGDDGRLYV